MGIGALAGAIGGAGEATHRNRVRRLDEQKYNIDREAADRSADIYQRETAFREIMSNFPDPTEQIEQAKAQATQGALPEDGMGPPAAPAGPPPKYRDRYRAWEKEAENLAMRAGGFEGLTKFQDMRVAMSKRMVLGYGIQAAQALHNKDVGSAVKLGNTALEVAPVDTGMQLEAKNGEVYIKNAGGDMTGPFNGDQLQGVIENFMKDPENWLDYRKQDEAERAALVDETQQGERIDVAERQADVAEGYLDITKKKLPADLSKTGAEVYSLLRNADAAYMRAQDTGEDTGLSAADLRSINEAIPTVIQNARIDPGSQWWGAMAKNPGVANMMQSGAIDTARLNLMSGGNYADAIGLAAFAFAPFAGVDQPEGVRIGGIGFKGEGDERRPYAVWNDKQIWIPPSVYTALNGQIQSQQKGGAEEGTAEPALDPFRQ